MKPLETVFEVVVRNEDDVPYALRLDVYRHYVVVNVPGVSNSPYVTYSFVAVNLLTKHPFLIHQTKDHIKCPNLVNSLKSLKKEFETIQKYKKNLLADSFNTSYADNPIESISIIGRRSNSNTFALYSASTTQGVVFNLEVIPQIEEKLAEAILTQSLVNPS